MLLASSSFVSKLKMGSVDVLCYGFLGVCSYFMLLWALKPLYTRLIRLPPGPVGVPILGNLLQLGSKPNESLQTLAQKYGPIMSLFLGMKTVVVISSPDMAKEILKTHDKDFAGRDIIQATKAMDHYKRSIVLGQQDAHWRLLRRISTTDLFGPKKLMDLHSIRRHQIFQTVHQVFQSSDRKACIDVRDLLLRSSLNLLGKMIFSHDMFESNSDSFSEFKDVMSKYGERGGSPNLVDFFPFLAPLDPQRVMRDTRFYMKKFYDILDAFIQNRIESPHSSTAPRDFLDSLMDQLDSHLTISDIKTLLVDLFSAGTDTTAITVEWAMAELIRNPKTMAKLQLELDEVVGNERIIEENDIDNLPYLRAVVKETLRLHPAAPLLIPHRAEKCCEVAGFVIPKNTTVLVNFWGIARDPSVWEDANKFIPERFVGSNLEFKGQNYEFIPFGAGRRMCVGMPLANRVVHSLVGALVQCFQWSLPDGEEEIDMKDKFGVTLHKYSPLLALAMHRLPAHVYQTHVN